MQRHTVHNPAEANQAAALWRAEKLHAQIVTDTVNLEGNPFTLPEVQTLIDGVTVGGRKVEDAEQVLNQCASWRELIRQVREGEFALSKENACALNALVARNEALAWDRFRDLEVAIAGTEYRPPAAEALSARFAAMLEAIRGEGDVLVQGMRLFLEMARQQFFCDGNKRTGRLMMNGALLQAGFDVLSIPAKRQLEFNEKMLRYYDAGEPGEMYAFLLSCSVAPHAKPSLNCGRQTARK